MDLSERRESCAIAVLAGAIRQIYHKYRAVNAMRGILVAPMSRFESDHTYRKHIVRINVAISMCSDERTGEITLKRVGSVALEWQSNAEWGGGVDVFLPFHTE